MRIPITGWFRGSFSNIVSSKTIFGLWPSRGTFLQQTLSFELGMYYRPMSKSLEISDMRLHSQ